MKRFLTSFCLLFLLLFLTPALALRSQTSPAASPPPENADFYTVTDVDTGEVLKLTPLEYVKGVVAAEMPASYHTEALKAQAVAAHSYALYRIRENLAADPDGAYLSTDPATCQAYLSADERRTLWGDRFDTYEQKLTEAVEPVIGKVLTYEGAPALAVFHAVSGGMTESAADLFGSEVTYLIPAESSADELSPNFLGEKAFTSAEMKQALSPLLSAELSDDPSDWFGAPTRTASGAVLDIPVGDQSVSGTALRNALSLPSANFTIQYADDTFTVQTRGYGHGVGMSQYGADFLARQGQTYEQILLHYYTGVTIEDI